jgi:mono/diheme cytochrome c family protein
MKTIVTVLITLLAIFVLGVLYIFSGSFDPGALKPHKKITVWIINHMVDASVEKRAKKIEVLNWSDTSFIREGFSHYTGMCQICHSGPGLDETEIAKGLYPRPPRFYRQASQMHPGETFWIIKNGIKMSGMPAFAPTHNDQRISSITSFIIKKLGSMTPEEYESWRKSTSAADD